MRGCIPQEVIPQKLVPEPLNLQLLQRRVALSWNHPRWTHTYRRSGADVGNSVPEIRVFPRFTMSDKTNSDDTNLKSAQVVTPDKGEHDLAGANDHLSTSNATPEKQESFVSEFDVWWSSPEDEDPANPRNWSNSQKWTIIASLSLVTFLTYTSP